MAYRRSIYAKEDETAEINLSPMIDCIFILLIFFIVTTVFVEKPDATIEKPFALTDSNLEKNSLILAITGDNRIIYGSREISLAGVSLHVKQNILKHEMPVIIQADVNADHNVFSKVWSECKRAGAKKISISTLKD